MRRFTENIKNKRALTLIEIIIVLAVLGILALIAVPRYINTLENAKRDADKNSVASVSDAIYLAIASEKIPMAEDTITLTGKNGEGINGELDKYDLVLSNLLGTAENRKLQVAEKAEFEILSDGSVEYVISWPSGSNN